MSEDRDDACHAGAGARLRLLVERRPRDPAAFRRALADLPPSARDACVDRALGLDGGDAIPDDGPALPAGGVPYLPCPAGALLRFVEHAPVRAGDLVVDVGSGAGRAAALVHLLTGARVLGIEIQPGLVAASRALAARLALSALTFVEGDAPQLGEALAGGSVFFLYCPFGGERLSALLARLERVAGTRPIAVGCVDLPLPPRDWLAPVTVPGPGDLAVYRSRSRSRGAAPTT